MSLRVRKSLNTLMPLTSQYSEARRVERHSIVLSGKKWVKYIWTRIFREGGSALNRRGGMGGEERREEKRREEKRGEDKRRLEMSWIEENRIELNGIEWSGIEIRHFFPRSPPLACFYSFSSEPSFCTSYSSLLFLFFDSSFLFFLQYILYPKFFSSLCSLFSSNFQTFFRWRIRDRGPWRWWK